MQIECIKIRSIAFYIIMQELCGQYPFTRKPFCAQAVIRVLLDYAEPATQDVSDGAPTTNGEYTFDEADKLNSIKTLYQYIKQHEN